MQTIWLAKCSQCLTSTCGLKVCPFQPSSEKDFRRLLADRVQLQQVFLNLIVNAIEAMHSVTDRQRTLRVTSDVDPGSSDIIFTVADSGVGIGGKGKDAIFEPFFTTKSAGMGIGLTICRSIIDSHGGSLRASANKPYGTIFEVVLPAE